MLFLSIYPEDIPPKIKKKKTKNMHKAIHFNIVCNCKILDKTLISIQGIVAELPTVHAHQEVICSCIE